MPTRSVLRDTIKQRDEVQELRLPPGLLQVIVQPERSRTTINVGFNRDDVINGTADTASLGSPWNSSLHQRNNGPLYFRADLQGAFIRVDAIHGDPTLDMGGGGGSATEFTVTYLPEADKVPINSDLSGAWAYKPRPLGWGQLSAWPDPMTAVIGAVGNDDDNAPSVEQGTSLLVANAWELKSARGLPAGATIVGIRLRLLGRKVPTPFTQQDASIEGNNHDVNMLRLSLMKDGIVQTYNYVDFDGNKNEVWPSGSPVWREFSPMDDRLWGTTWAVSNFTSGTLTHPSVSVATVVPGAADVNEIQRVAVPGTPTGGSFAITFKGVGPATINFNSTAAAFQTALEGLSNIAVGDVTVTGAAGGPWEVEFKATYAGTDVPLMVADGALLTGAATYLVKRTQVAHRSNKTNTHVGIIEVERRFQNDCLFKIQALANNLEPVLETPAHPASWWFFPENLITIQRELDPLWGAGNVRAYHAPLTRNNKTFRTLRWEYIYGYGGRDVRLEFLESFTGTRYQTVPFRISPLDGSPCYGNVAYFPGSDIEPVGCDVLRGECGSLQIGGAVITGGSNEKQQFRVLGNPAGGTFTLTHEGLTTAAIAWPASAATIETALEALANIGGVVVTEIATHEWEVEFNGVGDAQREHDLLTADVSALTAGDVSIITLQEAVTGNNEVQDIKLSGGNDTSGLWGITWDPGGGDETTANLAKTATAAQIQTALEGLASVAAGDVVVTGDVGGPFLVEFKVTYAKTNVNIMRPKTGFSTSEWGIAIAAGLVINNPTDVGQVTLEILDAELSVDYTT